MTVYMDRLATMHYNMSPAARLVAGSMLTEAQESMTTIVTWISTFLTDRGNKGDDEAETIQHMSHAMCTIMARDPTSERKRVVTLGMSGAGTHAYNG
jgi:hypothetical protein